MFSPPAGAVSCIQITKYNWGDFSKTLFVILKAHTFNLLMFHVVFCCFLVKRLIISSEVVELLHVTASGLSDMI